MLHKMKRNQTMVILIHAMMIVSCTGRVRKKLTRIGDVMKTNKTLESSVKHFTKTLSCLLEKEIKEIDHS